ncbi:hypothetical protein [Nakamurella sp.]
MVTLVATVAAMATRAANRDLMGLAFITLVLRDGPVRKGKEVEVMRCYR